MSSWVRSNFEGIGLTQSPPGKYLEVPQRQYGGTMLLCIDVSGSMSGEPLQQAIRGGKQFLREAVDAYYKCGNNLVPPLLVAKKLFQPLSGDRILCVFGDGDIDRQRAVVPLARELCAMGVRIVVRGLGTGATGATPGSRSFRRGQPGHRGRHVHRIRDRSHGGRSHRDAPKVSMP
jgi:hypothetical protein